MSERKNPGNIYELLEKGHKKLSRLAVYGVFDAKVFERDFYYEGLPFVSNFNSKISSLEQAKDLITLSEIQIRYGNYSDPNEYAYARKTKSLPKDVFFLNVKNSINDEYAGNLEVTWDIFNSIAERVPFFSKEDYEAPRIWLGPKGCITPLHKDGPDNFTYNILGRKRWLIFPVEDYPKLSMFAPKEKEYPDLHVSEVDVRKFTSVEEINATLGTSCIEIIMEPGTMLYLPSGWGHYVETLTPSLMINLWLSPKSHIAGRLKA